MNLLQDIVHTILGGHPQSQYRMNSVHAGPVGTSGGALPPAMVDSPQGRVSYASTIGQRQPLAPRAPMPVNSQVNPHSQMLYEQALNQMGKFTMPQRNQAFNTANNPQIQLGGDYGTPVQGQQNVGYIPMQGSRGVGAVQGGNDQTIQF